MTGQEVDGIFRDWYKDCKESARGYPKEVDFSMVRGDTFVFSARVNIGGSPRMLGDGHVYFAICADDGTAIVNKSFSSLNQDENGFVSISLMPEETADIKPGLYSYEVEFRFSEALVITAVKGTLDIRSDHITKEVRNESRYHS